MSQETKQQADDNQLTTVQITKGTSRVLAQLAKAYRRSKTDQLAWMVALEAAKLSDHKLLPSADDTLTAVEPLA